VVLSLGSCLLSPFFSWPPSSSPYPPPFSLGELPHHIAPPHNSPTASGQAHCSHLPAPLEAGAPAEARVCQPGPRVRPALPPAVTSCLGPVQQTLDTPRLISLWFRLIWAGSPHLFPFHFSVKLWEVPQHKWIHLPLQGDSLCPLW
jgi:hypothetical protein